MVALNTIGATKHRVVRTPAIPEEFDNANHDRQPDARNRTEHGDASAPFWFCRPIKRPSASQFRRFNRFWLSVSLPPPSRFGDSTSPGSEANPVPPWRGNDGRHPSVISLTAPPAMPLGFR